MKHELSLRNLSALFLGAILTHSIGYGASELDFLKLQLHKQDVGSLAQSYAGSDRFYTYDQALAVLTFTQSGDQDSAHQILSAMKSLQAKDGSWIFSYPAHENILPRSGSIAWMVIAINHYSAKYKSHEFDSTRDLAIHYFEQNSFQENDFFGPKFSNVNEPNSTWDKTQVLSVEHLIDWIAAFDTLPGDVKQAHADQAERMRKTLLNHWVGEHFAPGSIVSTKKMNFEETYLDTQAWAALLKWKKTDQNWIHKGLAFNCRTFLKRNGFQESLAQQSNPEFAWMEGTFMMDLALKTQRVSCPSRAPAAILSEPNGGVPYSIQGQSFQFSEKSSVAATAWKYFSSTAFNPFQLDPT